MLMIIIILNPSILSIKELPVILNSICKLYSELLHLGHTFIVNQAIKGIVQRDLTLVETRLKKSVLLSYSVGKFFFGIL